MIKGIMISDLLDLDKTIAKSIFDNKTYPWEALPEIEAFILSIGSTLDPDAYDHPEKDIWISKRAKVALSAYIGGPCIIDHEASVRHCAFIRSSAIVGKGAVVGNSTELKNVILFDQVQVPHYNYIGDSVLGYKVHLGAGAITSNVKSDKSYPVVRVGHQKVETGIRKFGAIIGDGTEIGCNSVLNPATIVGRESMIYPLSMVRGYVPAMSIYKRQGEIVPKKMF